MSDDKLWWCAHCWQEDIETWASELGPRWVCKTCGLHGLMSDPDAPRFVTAEEREQLEEGYRRQCK